MFVPELDVADLARSLHFYTRVLGFRVLFERRAERFAYLERDGVELMVQEAAGPGRRFRTAPLEPPFGRGVNFQLRVDDVDAVHARAAAAGAAIVLAMEERWYQVDVARSGGRWTSIGPTEAGNRQFVVADPDGYLWRPFRDLGTRPADATAAGENSASSTGSLLVVTGPPGAGKSTVAPLVAERLGGAVACIEADWFWTTITTGFIPPWEPESNDQNQTILRTVVSAAAEMAVGGYQVAIEGVIGPWHLPTVTGITAARGLDLDYVVLRPDLATCLARAHERAAAPTRVPGNPPLTASGPIRHLWEQFSGLGTYESHVIDTTALHPSETVDRIARLLDSGRLRVATDR